LYALRRPEGDGRVAEVCRRLGVSEQTFYVAQAWDGARVKNIGQGGRDLSDEKRRGAGCRSRRIRTKNPRGVRLGILKRVTRWEIWCARRDSNARPLAPEARTGRSGRHPTTAQSRHVSELARGICPRMSSTPVKTRRKHGEARPFKGSPPGSKRLRYQATPSFPRSPSRGVASSSGVRNSARSAAS
jgi:transposase-like protein